jgi:hypothetical protein
MPGQHEQRDELEELDQLDPREATLDLSRLIERVQQQIQAEGHGKVNGTGPNGTSTATVNGTGTARPASAPETTGEMAALPEESPASASAAAVDLQQERIARGSLADLRRRLERLPFGHPSSPHHVDGERKPPPPRLRHLELAPPGPSRTTDESARLSWAASSAELDGDPAESPVLMEAVPDPVPEVPDATGRAASRPRDPVPGPRTEADGAWTWGSARLTRDQVRIAEEAHDRFGEAAGHDIFGGFSSSGLTATLRSVGDQLETGRLAPGAEEHALIEPDEFKARFASMIRRHPERTAEQLAGRVPGALTYSFVFDTEQYSAGIWALQHALEAAGFLLQARKNAWSSAENRCVLAMWRDPASSLSFEVQFHTRASLEAQHLARSSANLISDPRIPAAETANLKSDVASVWAALPAPPGNSQISDYRRGSGVTASGQSPRPDSRHPESTP